MRRGTLGAFLLALACLATPLPAQSSPVGTWQVTEVLTIRGTDVLKEGVIVFEADHTYSASLKWSWLEQDVRTGAYAFSEGTWETAPGVFCVTRSDRARPVCNPALYTDAGLLWGGYQFTKVEEN